MQKKRIVIIGATSAIAEHCARLWTAREPVDMVLVGRSQERTERVAQDLRVRAPGSSVTALAADFQDPAAIGALVDRLFQEAPVDMVLIAHGLLPEQAACQQDLGLCREALIVNGVSPALFAEAFVRRMEEADRGTVALMGSVAGDRGRKTNYVYGAGKGLLARYAQGLQHRLAGGQVKVVLVEPGPTDTPMTAHLKGQGARLAGPQEVAAAIVAAMDRGKPVCYAPAIWQVIMLVLRHLPRAVFHKLNI